MLNCFTRSEYAPFSDVDLVHANDRTSFVSALRRREDLDWQRRMGGKLTLHDLDLLDAPLRLACAVDEVTSVEIRPGDRAVARLAGAVSKLLRTGPAGQTALLAPLAIGGHIDHRVARQAVLDTVAGSQTPVAFYEDLPYAAAAGVASRLEAFAAGVDADLAPMLTGEPAPDLDVAIARKARMAECYDSQIDSEVAARIAVFCGNYAGRERVWANHFWRERVPSLGQEALP